MRKISMITLPFVLIAAGFVIGAFMFGNQGSAQASVPAQQMDLGADRWIVASFEVLSFDKTRWDLIGREGGCVVYRSDPTRETVASVLVRTEQVEITLEYPRQGARVRVCPGFTVHFPPTSTGNAPTERDN